MSGLSQDIFLILHLRKLERIIGHAFRYELLVEKRLKKDKSPSGDEISSSTGWQKFGSSVKVGFE